MTDETKPKILLVDDDKFLLDIYSLKFKNNGINIDTFSSSKEALAKLQSGEKYDVIILDIIMPGIDGMEMLKAIKQDKLCEEASIVMLTNQSDDQLTAEGLGIEKYIIKATTIPSEVV